MRNIERGAMEAPRREQLSTDLARQGTLSLGASQTTWQLTATPPSATTVTGVAAPSLPMFVGEVEMIARPSPYNYAAFSRFLAQHPCTGLRDHVLDGLAPGSGFGYDFTGDRSQRTVSENWGALQRAHNPHVWAKVMKQVAARTMFGPISRPPFPNESCPFQPQEVSTGSVSKDKWNVHPDPGAVRVVSDFVSNGQNDLRSGDYLSSIYFQIRHLIMIILLLGVGTIVILWDVQGAYRTLNAKQGDWHLQVSWLIDPDGVKQFFVDFVNPFGRIDAQRNWEAFAGAIEWIMHDLKAVFVRHYVDNFFDFVRPRLDGRPDWYFAEQRAKWIFGLMKVMGVPFHEVQIGTSFQALGWMWDTVLMIVVVKEEKRSIARRLLSDWVQKESCTLREVERLIGFLYWLCMAFIELLPFLGRLLEVKRRGYVKLGEGQSRNRSSISLRLSVRTQSDIRLCRRLLLEWSGTRRLWDWEVPKVTFRVWCDASTWGFGAYCLEAKEYFFRKWTSEEKRECFRESRFSLMQFESRAAVAALKTWGPLVACSRVEIRTDNEWSQVHLTSGFCKQPDCQRTIRAFWLQKLQANCVVDVFWLKSESNLAADLLSRNQERVFREMPTFADFSRVPARVPRSW